MSGGWSKKGDNFRIVIVQSLSRWNFYDIRGRQQLPSLSLTKKKRPVNITHISMDHPA